MSSNPDIIVRKVNEVYMKVECDASTQYEIQDYFSFYAPGYKFNPKFKNKIWDGKIRLYNLSNRQLYVGLYHKLEEFAEERGYNITSDILIDKSDVSYDIDIMSESKFEPRDYQVDAIKHGLDNKRCVLLSPTGSGKSFIIYNLIRHIDRKALIIVPTISLVHQMRSDFIDYFAPSEDLIYTITAGVPRTTDLPIVVSTWQSIYQQPKEWFDQFDVVIGDECLHPETEITLSDGTTKKICDVNVGDFVMTFNEDTHSYEPKIVNKVHKNISVNEQMYEVILDNGKTIKITGNHKVLLVSGEWKRIDEVEIGDIINGRCG